MATKLTTEDFIKKAQAVHGETYDYSECVYLNNYTHVVVLCRTHGAFSITPSNHTDGEKPTGCAKCSKEYQSSLLRSTSSDFIRKSKVIPGNKYIYEQVDYRGAFKPVEIICPNHGSFMQQPTSHLGGSGCRKCADEGTSERCIKSVDDFIKQSREIHGDKFDYSQVDYNGSWIPVKIHCPVHGWFEQAPVCHLNSVYGCSKCAIVITHNKARKEQDEFIKQAVEAHGNKYDYSMVDYKGGKIKVIIGCPIHGSFEQSPSKHIMGNGCNKCGNILGADKLRSTIEAFIMKAREKHGDTYDYSKAEYVTARKSITIICPVHGEFRQVPGSHLKGGCRKCADEALPGAYSATIINRDPALASSKVILYYVKFTSDEEVFYKIGITRSSVKIRFGGYEFATGYTIEVLNRWDLTLADAHKIEQKIKVNHCSICNYRPKYSNRDIRPISGYTECFSQPLPDDFIQSIFP
jgi:hypothetical protein